MKLYLWEGVLRDYSEGVMFALAENEEQARTVIIARVVAEGWDTKWIEQVKKELTQSGPSVIDEPFGFCLWGGG